MGTAASHTIRCITYYLMHHILSVYVFGNFNVFFCVPHFTLSCAKSPFSSQDLTLQDAPLLLLALYEKATLSRASALPSRQLLPDV